MKVSSASDITVTDEEVLAAGGEMHSERAHIVPDSTSFNVIANSVWPFSGLLDLMPYLCVERLLFCLSVGCLEAVRVQCLEWPESASVVQCDDDAEGCSRFL